MRLQKYVNKKDRSPIQVNKIREKNDGLPFHPLRESIKYYYLFGLSLRKKLINQQILTFLFLKKWRIYSKPFWNVS